MILSSSIFYSDHALFPMSSIKLLVSAALNAMRGKVTYLYQKDYSMNMTKPSKNYKNEKYRLLLAGVFP